VFGMKNFAGEQYDRTNGGTMVPVNNYLNYGIPIQAPNNPIQDGDVRVRTVSEQTSFTCQNIELNFLRLPLLCCGCSAPSCDSGCGGYGLGDYGCGGCGQSGCCQPTCSAFTLTGLCGVRFFRIDDDFNFGDTFYVQTAGSPGADDTINFS